MMPMRLFCVRRHRVLRPGVRVADAGAGGNARGNPSRFLVTVFPGSRPQVTSATMPSAARLVDGNVSRRLPPVGGALGRERLRGERARSVLERRNVCQAVARQGWRCGSAADIALLLSPGER
jgi:hypothetical protein